MGVPWSGCPRRQQDVESTCRAVQKLRHLPGCAQHVPGVVCGIRGHRASLLLLLLWALVLETHVQLPLTSKSSA